MMGAASFHALVRCWERIASLVAVSLVDPNLVLWASSTAARVIPSATNIAAIVMVFGYLIPPYSSENIKASPPAPAGRRQQGHDCATSCGSRGIRRHEGN